LTRISVLYFFSPLVLFVPGSGLDLAFDEELGALFDMSRTTSAVRWKQTRLCHSVLSAQLPWASFWRSAVAREKLATVHAAGGGTESRGLCLTLRGGELLLTPFAIVKLLRISI